MRFTFINLIYLLSYAETALKLKTFPMICAFAHLEVTRMLTAPLNLSTTSEGCNFISNFNYNTLLVPSYTNLPCLPSYWVMFEHTRSFRLKKICALIKGWRLVISCLHKSSSFVKPITHECLICVTCTMSKNDNAIKLCSSSSFIFAGVRRKHSTTKFVREGISTSWLSNEWHLWVSAKYLIIDSAPSVRKTSNALSAFNLKNSNMDLVSVDNRSQMSKHIIDASINRTFQHLPCFVWSRFFLQK